MPITKKEELTIGGSPLREFKENRARITCKAKELNISIEKNAITVEESKSSFFRREEVKWTAEYSLEKNDSFLFDVGVYHVGVLKDKMPKIMVINNEVRVKGDELHVPFQCASQEELESFRRAGVKFGEEGFLSLGEVRKALQLVNDGVVKVKEGSLAKGRLETIAAFENEIRRAGEVAKDVVKLWQHPRVKEKFNREELHRRHLE